MRHVLSRDEFSRRASAKDLPDEFELRKGLALAGGVKALDDADGMRRMGFIISSESVDRESDVIIQSGWDLKNYLANPVVLFAHNQRGLPIGQAESVTLNGTRLESVARFTPAGTYDLADTVYDMLKGGFLRATSVGFIPRKWAFDEERRGYDFIETELLEYSVVPIPANPDALVQARSAGIDLRPLKHWSIKLLDELAGIDEMFGPVNRETVTAALKTLRGETVSVAVPALDGTKATQAVDPTDVSTESTSTESLGDVVSARLATLETKIDQLAALFDVDDELVTKTDPTARPTSSETVPAVEATASAADLPVGDETAIDLDALFGSDAQRRLGLSTAAASTTSEDVDVDPQELAEIVRRAVRSSLDEALAVRSGRVPAELPLEA